MKQLSFTDQRKFLHSCYDDGTKRGRKLREQTCDLIQGPKFIDLELEEQREAYRRTLYPRGCGKLYPIGWAGNSMVRCGANCKELDGSITLLQCDECLAKKSATPLTD